MERSFGMDRGSTAIGFAAIDHDHAAATGPIHLHPAGGVT